MSAVTTGGKPGHKIAVQLTFPEVFSTLYAEENVPLRFAPEGDSRAKPFQQGDDLQANWHQIKKAEADRRALNAVKDTKTARLRYVVSPSGYWKLPKPVLSQRKFANPSYGASGAYSARNDWNTGAPFQCPLQGGHHIMDEDELHGGVMRTVKGREWASKRLYDRISQLNAIDEASSTYNLDVPVGDLSYSTVASTEPATLVEFNTLRQSVIDALATGGLGRVDLSSVSQMVTTLLRIAPTAEAMELQDIIKGFETIMELLSGYEEEQMAIGTEYTQPYNRTSGSFVETKLAFLSGIEQLMDKAHKYSEIMYKHVNDSPSERMDVSRNAIKSLGFTKLLTSVRKFGFKGESGKPVSERRTKRIIVAPNPENMSGDFTVPSESASNQQANGRSAEWSRNVRDVWAKRTSRGFFGEESMAKFGDELRNTVQPRPISNAIFPDGQPSAIDSKEDDLPPPPRRLPGRPKKTAEEKGATIAEMRPRVIELMEESTPERKPEGSGRAKKSTGLKGLIRRLKNRR